jgi:hypothetical protein
VTHIIYNEINSGTSYKQWYKGIEYAKGELIWIAESDDWCDERFLEAVVPHFQDNEVSIAFVNTLYVYPGDRIDINPVLTGRFDKILGIDFIRDKMLIGNGIDNTSMTVFRRNQYNKVKNNGFRELKLCGDWLLWSQLMHRFKIVSVQDNLNYCRRHSANAAKRFTALGLDFIEGVRVLRIGKKLCNNQFDRKLIYSIWLDRFYRFRNKFSKGVLIKVFLNLLKYDPLMFSNFIFSFIYNITRTKIKILWKVINEIHESNRIKTSKNHS